MLVLSNSTAHGVGPESGSPELDPNRIYLRPVKAVSEPERAAFSRFLERFSNRTERDDFSTADEFLREHPRGAWSLALRLRLAEEFYNTGWYSRAIRTLEELWAERGRDGTADGAVLTTRAGVQLAELYARLGRTEDAEAVVAVLEKGTVATDDLETLRGVQQGLATRQRRPEAAFRCGAVALERVRVFLQSTNAGHPALLNSTASRNGMSLADVARLSEATGMNYQMAFRSAGAPLVTPAVMHLRIGHFVALLRKVQGKLQIDDPTGWQTTFTSEAALEAEASGYFLVPPGPLPKGWRRVDAAEGASVFGRNGVLENDPDATSKCDKTKCKPAESSRGMAEWDVHLMLISQQIVDTPIGYQPPFGPRIDVTWRHTQRANQRFGYKPKWTHNWSGQIFENPCSPLGDLWIQEEGGWERFSALDDEGKTYQGRIFNTGRLRRTDSRTLAWEFPDGTKNTYSTFNGTNVAWGRVFYLSAIEDPAGNRVTIQLLANGRVESVTDPLGRMTRFYYELQDPGIPPGTNVVPNLEYTNQVTRIVDPFGRTATLHYSKVVRSITGFCLSPDGTFECPFYYYNYDLTNITDVAGLSSRFAYDGSGLLVSELTTPYGTTKFRWFNPAFGGALDVTDPEGETERFEFTLSTQENNPALRDRPQGMRTEGPGYAVAHWNKSAYAESLQASSLQGATLYVFQFSETFGGAGRGLMGIKEPLENMVWFNYPGQGSALLPGIGLQTTRMGRVLDDGSTQLWQHDRDAWGNVTRTVDPLGRTTRYVYAPNFIDLLEARRVVVGSGEQLLYRISWNSQHLPLTFTDPAGQTTRFAYNSRGQLTSVTNPRNETKTYTYDANGFLAATDGPLPGTQDRLALTYDAIGRLRTATDADGYTLTFDYDALDRITTLTFPDGTSDTRTYDRMDLAMLRDRLGRESRFTYDGMRRLTSVQNAMGDITRFQWCGCGELRAMIDPLGRMTQWHQDIQGRLIEKEYADGSKIHYEYERTTSRLHRRRDERNQITELTYNLADELLARRYLNALRPTPDVFFSYDMHYRRLTSMTDGNGTTSFEYFPINGQPGAGQLASVDGPWANDKVDYTYDELGRLIKRAIQGAAVTRIYDAGGRVTQITNGLGVFSQTWEGGSRRLSSVIYPNGQHSDFAYFGNDHDHLLQRITHFLSSGAKLSEFTYARDASGRITQWTQTQAGRTKTWAPSYDAMDRLTNVVELIPPNPGTERSWIYDPADNLTSAVETNGIRRDFVHNALNQFVGMNSTLSNVTSGYEWDAENRLVAISNATHRVEFSYDGLGRRTRVVERDGATILSDRRYLWCDWQLCEERDASGANVLKRYSYFGFENVAAPELPFGSYFFTRDHLGSIREITGGGAASAFDYLPFGEQQQLQGSLPSDFGWTGHFQNRSTATVLAVFRPYAPALGRWLSRDPVGEWGGLNLYAYAGNDPINRRDALGLWSAAGHDFLIKNAFQNRLSAADIQAIQKASRDFDDATQSAEDSPKHSMRRPGQTAREAIVARDSFVGLKLAEARRAVRCGNRAEALKLFGEAIHPVMDKTSPLHTDAKGNPKVWDPTSDASSLLEALQHGWTDSFISGEAVGDVTPDIAGAQALELNKLYDQVFGNCKP